jgi:hypothetical protein
MNEELNSKLKLKVFAYHLVFDASGMYSGGLFFGQTLRPANPEQCQEINDELNLIITANEEINNTLSYVPFFVQIVNAKYVAHVDNKVRNILFVRVMLN